jgi:HEAT repeat protein
MYFRRKQSQGRFYLQIVESHRSGDQVRQRVIATLGRLDELEASGQLDRLLRSGARFVRQAMVLDAARSGDAPAIAVRRIGPALLFERLWQETGCQDVIAGLARKRGHRFVVEREVFLTVLHRLMRGGSDLAADRWRDIIALAAPRTSTCTTCTVPWPGSVRHCPPSSRMMRRRSRCAAPRI